MDGAFFLVLNMNKNLLVWILISCSGSLLYAQDTSITSKYLEDQIYAGVAYNFLDKRPTGVILRNLSYNLKFGVIKDIPFNAQRNFGIGFGVGYSTNSYYSNIVATETTDGINYELLEAGDLKRSKFETHGVEFPFEIRWRTSNAEDYKFWRLYSGLSFEYLFSQRSKVVSDTVNSSFTNQDINNWQYGITLNFGYNTFNIHLYYSLTPLLNDSARLNEDSIQVRPIRIGVIFYIL